MTELTILIVSENTSGWRKLKNNNSRFPPPPKKKETICDSDEVM